LAGKRRTREQQRPRIERRSTPTQPSNPLDEMTLREAQTILDEELAALPDKHRDVLLLCCLQDRTRDEAAQELGLTPSVVKSRLEEARRRLRQRLRARGIEVSAALLGVLFARGAPVSAQQISATCRAGLLFRQRTDPNTTASLLANNFLEMGTMSNKMPLVALAGVCLLLGSLGWAIAYPEEAARDKPPMKAEPPFKPEHKFAPIDPQWRREVTYLLPGDELDPPNSFQVIQPRDRDPSIKTYHKEISYYEKGQAQRARRILRYGPDGSLRSKYDNVGDEQFGYSYYPDGSPRGYIHWRAGKWLNGYSISPDGKTVHRLKDGNGELVGYGSKPGNFKHEWYHAGIPFLVKHIQNGNAIRIRLNDRQDYLIVTAKEEQLSLEERQEWWYKRAGEQPRVQKFDQSPVHPGWERRPDPKKLAAQYQQLRKEFLGRVGKALKREGHTWESLGIDFIRRGEA
jgi:hypothetical protein